MEQKIDFQRERDFGELINVTVLFIKQNFKQLGKASLIYLLPFGLVIGALMGIYQHESLALTLGGSHSFSLQIISILLLMVVMMIAFSIMPALIMQFFNEYRQVGPGNVDISKVWEKTKESFSVIILTTLGLAGIMIAIIFVMVLLAFVTPWILAIFVIPFIYAVVAVYFIYPIRIYEDTSFGEALSRSFYLVSGSWWRTFLVYIVVSLLVGLVSYIFLLPMYIYIITITFASAKGSSFESSMGIMIAVNIFAFAGQIVLSTVPLITLNFQYFNLLEKKDKPGLLKRVNDLLPNETTVDAQ